MDEADAEMITYVNKAPGPSEEIQNIHPDFLGNLELLRIGSLV